MRMSKKDPNQLGHAHPEGQFGFAVPSCQVLAESIFHMRFPTSCRDDARVAPRGQKGVKVLQNNGLKNHPISSIGFVGNLLN